MGLSHPAAAQTVRGFVTAASDRQPLQGVHVILDDLSDGAQDRATGDGIQGAITDGDGFYAITRLGAGTYQLRASYIGFQTVVDTLTIEPDEQRTLNIILSDAAAEMDDVLVEAERDAGAAHITAGQQTVRPEEIELVPSPDVSGDLVSYLATMPGVVMTGDQGGQVFIRGGEPTHNLTLLDGMYIFQPFHILGFYSAYPTDIISRADVFAGGFGSRYSGRISSVIDVQTRTGNKRSFAGSMSVSPFAGTARLEGPLIPDYVSFLGSARVSMLDQLASHIVDDEMPYRFSDLFGKVHAVIAGSHRVAVSGLQTYDRGTLSSEDDLFAVDDQVRWRNRALGLRYLVAPRAMPILGELLVSYSRLDSELGPADEPVRTSYSEMINVALNVTNYFGGTQMHWGGFLREPRMDARLGGLFQDLEIDPGRSVNAGGYVEPDIYLGGGFRVRPGVVVQMVGSKGTFAEPRLRMVLERGRHTFSAATGLYRQEIVGLTDRRDASSIFTAWVETPFGEASRAVHGLLGYRTQPFRWLEVSIEGYMRRMDDLFISRWTAFPSFSTRLQRAEGRTAGLDLRLEVRRAGFYGFVNYGLASTRYEIDPQDAANSEPFRPPHDRRHQINLLASTTILGFDVSLRWHFGSGLPFTRIEAFDGFILMDGNVRVDSIRGFPRVIYESEPYRGTLPTYHRLDVTVDRTFELVPGVEATVQAGVLNAYDRRNIFSLDLFSGRRSDQLPIVPILGIKLEV